MSVKIFFKKQVEESNIYLLLEASVIVTASELADHAVRVSATHLYLLRLQRRRCRRCCRWTGGGRHLLSAQTSPHRH